jgi:hypothetical protein
MPAFTNIAALCKSLREKIDNVLENEVAEKAKDTMREKIDEVVYSAYTPSIYSRRELGSGGLKADDAIVPTLMAEGILEIANVAEFNQAYPTNNQGYDLVSLIEYGDGGGGHYYDYPKMGAGFMGSRPFVAETRRELEEGKLVWGSLRTGLIARGLDVNNPTA